MICAACGVETDASPCGACGRDPRLRERWHLVAMLGQGAHGTTWRAEDPDSGEVRAIKELPVRLGTPSKRVELFRREAEVLQQLDHPGIPRCHETWEAGQGKHRALYIAQDLVPGESLQRELRHRRYDEGEVLDVVEELLGVLVYLHGRSPPVVHRDLKPANVIRTPEGPLALVDFGSVQDALRDADLGGSTVAGTFGFMAPEQFSGDAEPRTDLYGLGALAVALLTRKPPHSLQDATGALDWRSHAALSPPAAAFLSKLLAPDVVDRFPTSEHALEALRRVRAGDTRPMPPVLDDRPLRAAQGGGRPLTVAPPRTRGTRLDLQGSARTRFGPEDHPRLITRIERTLGFSGRTDVLGDTLRWHADPTRARSLRVVLEPRDAGTHVHVAEDLRPVFGGFYGGLVGGLGGGLAGGTGWLVFMTAGVLGGLVYVAAVLLFSFLLATGFVRLVRRARIVELDILVDDLQEELGGSVVARPGVWMPSSPGLAWVGAAGALFTAVGTALVGALAQGMPYPVLGVLVMGFFGALLVGGRGRSVQRDRDRHERRMRKRRQAELPAWDLDDLEEDDEDPVDQPQPVAVRGRGFSVEE